ncbi:MAG TPA: Gfo/Idh/MocA family oxidoreductase [Tepidisphaeraceae bacterium]
MIRLGVIGCGVIATYGHLPAILQTAGLSLYAVMDTDPQKLAEAQQRFNVPNGFDNIDAFMQSGIDAVVICSPAPVHHHDVMACARYGKPALCEKPLAMSESEAQQMIDVMRDARLPLYVGFTYRFAPAAMEIHRLLREGVIGEVRSLRLIYVWDCHGKYNRRGDAASGLYDRRVGRMLEGGPMVDCGVHQIDLARWWTGQEVRRVAGHGAWVETEGYHFPDHVYLHMNHQGGVHTTVEISFTYGHTALEPRVEFVYELIGSDGLIRYDRQTRTFECVTRAGTKTLEWTEEKNFNGMYAEFERALRTGDAGQMPTAADGLAATRIARIGTEVAVAGRDSAPNV